jgi:AraC-like DNA-binding protein
MARLRARIVQHVDTDRERNGAPRSYVRRDTELGSWEVAERRPAPDLRGLVSSCRAYAQQRPGPSSHRTLPQPGAPLVISLGARHVIRDRAGRAITRGSFVAGPHDRDVVVEADGFVGLQADLTPLGAFLLVGGGLRELTDQIVELEDILGAADARRLLDDLACEPDPHRRTARLEAALRARLATAPTACPKVTWALDRIERTGGAVPVGVLATELGWSPRHLTRRFTEQVGLPPKRFARVVRFHRAATLLERPDGPGLAEIAQLTGYYDQAHLSNEVRELCGRTPAELRARVISAPPA